MEEMIAADDSNSPTVPETGAGQGDEHLQDTHSPEFPVLSLFSPQLSPQSPVDSD